MLGNLTLAEVRQLKRFIEFLLDPAWIHELMANQSEVMSAAKRLGYFWWRSYEAPFENGVIELMKELELEAGYQEAGTQNDPFRARFNYLLNEVLMDNPAPETAGAEKLNRVLNLLMGLYYSMAAVAYFNVPMHRLLERARDGDVDALRDAVSVDKLVLAASVGTEVVAAAQANGKVEILGRVFSRPEPYPKRRVYRVLKFMIQTLDEIGGLDGGITRDVIHVIQVLGLDPKRGDDSGNLLRGLIKGFLAESSK
jgi:hypothetical protein